MLFECRKSGVEGFGEIRLLVFYLHTIRVHARQIQNIVDKAQQKFCVRVYHLGEDILILFAIIVTIDK